MEIGLCASVLREMHALLYVYNTMHNRELDFVQKECFNIEVALYLVNMYCGHLCFIFNHIIVCMFNV